MTALIAYFLINIILGIVLYSMEKKKGGRIDKYFAGKCLIALIAGLPVLIYAFFKPYKG